ncbi:hypothetical protein WICPIJ_002969 [Wickerhamomyces pijperi]|uniref:MoaB/Mog domain-containing protein n=1 Tax=Wickerhamomyces pijperi TaxID=599730 RepID=A0A9P8QAP9_WICPI|nr:hypothetical protein WICPIJ_002969 [Wickerhamomyces pijperi]
MSAIETAAILIIGDEVLNGKIKDTNSHFFSQLMFNKGVTVKKILVIGDEESEIVESIRDLSQKYDFVLTSGGIGPTHDDITYESIAKSYGLPLSIHQETAKRMERIKGAEVWKSIDDTTMNAQLRMATFPEGPNVEALFLDEKLWVPVVGIDKKVFILPGVPQLFKSLLTNLVDGPMKSRFEKAEENNYIRFFVTTKFPESKLSSFLGSIQTESDAYIREKYGAEGASHNAIKLGSYPHMGIKLNTISLLGRSSERSYLRELVARTVKELEGTEIDEKQEYSNSQDSRKITEEL